MEREQKHRVQEKPGIEGFAALPMAASHIPGKNLCFLVTRATNEKYGQMKKYGQMNDGTSEQNETRAGPSEKTSARTEEDREMWRSLMKTATKSKEKK